MTLGYKPETSNRTPLESFEPRIHLSSARAKIFTDLICILHSENHDDVAIANSGFSFHFSASSTPRFPRSNSSYPPYHLLPVVGSKTASPTSANVLLTNAANITGLTENSSQNHEISRRQLDEPYSFNLMDETGRIKTTL